MPRKPPRISSAPAGMRAQRDSGFNSQWIASLDRFGRRLDQIGEPPPVPERLPLGGLVSPAHPRLNRHSTDDLDKLKLEFFHAESSHTRI